MPRNYLENFSHTLCIERKLDLGLKMDWVGWQLKLPTAVPTGT